jgi:hypothetical protein
MPKSSCDKHGNSPRGRYWNEIMCVKCNVRKLLCPTTLLVSQFKHESMSVMQLMFIFVFDLCLFSLNFCPLLHTNNEQSLYKQTFHYI